MIGRFRYSVIYAAEPALIRVLAVAPHSKEPGYWAYRTKP